MQFNPSLIHHFFLFLDPSCSTPKHFSSNDVIYATRICSTSASHKFTLNESQVMPREEEMLKYNWDSVIAAQCQVLQKLLLVEIMLICCVYMIVKSLLAAGSFGMSNPQNLLNSHTKAPYYLLIQVGAACLWLLFAILSISHSSLSTKDAQFYCHYTIRRLGNLNRLVVQCVEQGEVIIYAALMANFGLCLVLGLTKAVHVVSAFLIQPLMSRKSVAATLMDSGIIKNPNQVGAGFAVSDLHFAMMTNGCDIKVGAGKGGENEAFELKE